MRTWVAQAEIDAGEQPGLTTEQRAELARLRQENRRLQADDETAQASDGFYVEPAVMRSQARARGVVAGRTGWEPLIRSA